MFFLLVTPSLLSKDVYMTYTCTLVDGEIHGVQRELSYNFVHNSIGKL